jgi:hypothetical protein
VGPRADLSIVDKKKNLALPEIEPRLVDQLSYPGSSDYGISENIFDK